MRCFMAACNIDWLRGWLLLLLLLLPGGGVT
jgi:hypothetical protein